MAKTKWVSCICPVCNGSGLVQFGFYTQTSGQWSSCGGTEGCRSCGGTGIVWSSQIVDAKNGDAITTILVGGNE